MLVVFHVIYFTAIVYDTEHLFHRLSFSFQYICKILHSNENIANTVEKKHGVQPGTNFNIYIYFFIYIKSFLTTSSFPFLFSILTIDILSSSNLFRVLIVFIGDRLSSLDRSATDVPPYVGPPPPKDASRSYRRLFGFWDGHNV